MADDREILREIWDGRLPICFQLAFEEVITMQQPDPYYLLVPRQSYFPLVMDKVRKHFTRFIQPEPQDAEMWLEYNGTPIKWHYPIGVLFDLLAYDALLPWCITVHFQKFPENELLRCPSRDAVESHYMSAVKEADMLKHRSQVVNTMQKKDHNQLWSGLVNDKFDQFWVINRKLMERPNDEFFKYIPFRIYQVDEPLIQRLFKPVNASDEVLTVQQFFQEMIPQVLENPDKLKAIIQGIQVPLETPVQWLSEHFSHPDNFLHICIVPAT